ncbi:MAG: hydrogenase small subunit, partial [Planctomycetota bacterium]|nr:hydrogenase small subunit [Planctomycetota bacterium]
MPVTRRDMLKASAIVAGALGLTGAGILRTQQALAKVGGLKIVWLQAQSCTGCSVSLLNSIYYATIDNLLLNTLDLKYHSNVMAAAGKQASDAAEAAYTAGGYALVVEGAIPTADNGKACNLWPGLTAMAGVTRYASRATMVLAVGTCASFGGMAAGKPNPTLATSVKGLLGTAFTKPLINIPGCPVHPDWVVGTIAYILTNNKAPALDANLRPTSFYGAKVHDACPNRNSYTGPNHHSKGRVCTTCHGRGLEEDALNPNQIPAFALSQVGCLYNL